MSREDYKNKILGCIRDRCAYPSEIADRLSLDLDVCFALVEELQKEGKIEFCEKSGQILRKGEESEE